MVKPLSPEDEARLPLSLLQALREGNAVALIGAGLSRALGFPSWIELLRKLAEETLQDGNTDARERILAKATALPEWVGEVLKHHSPDAYVKTLRRLFSSYPTPKFSLNHALLAALPFRGYLTTNYDHLVEDYVGHLDDVAPYVATPFQDENLSGFIREQGRFVLKIHGCANRDAGKLVLASSEYFELVRDQRYERLLAFLFQRYSIVTLGFGLADRDLTRFIEERRHLYGNKCPTVYALVPSTETTAWEIDAYRKLYNVAIVPVDPVNRFEQLTSMLLSLYCLVHSTDSRAAGEELKTLAMARYCSTSFVSSDKKHDPPAELDDAQRYLSVFQDPIPLDRFSSWLATDKQRFTSAHYRLLGQLGTDGKLSIRNRSQARPEDMKRVGLWLRNEIGQLSEEMTAFDKQSLGTYTRTITALLSTSDGASAILDHDRSDATFKIISQFFKQTGRWVEWLGVLEHVSSYCTSFTTAARSDLINGVDLDRIWVLLWQRRNDDALHVFQQNANLVNLDKGRRYSRRIQCRKITTADEIDKIIEEINKTGANHLDDISLLGQLCARRALLEPPQKNAWLTEARKYYRDALDKAGNSGKIRDVSVQSYYVACVEADLGNVKEAQTALAEIKRIDGAILNRAPGKAWQFVAEYRVELAQAGSNAHTPTAISMRSRALDALKELGIYAPEEVVDKDYYS